jgi:adenosylcobinamide-phosphate synthase
VTHKPSFFTPNMLAAAYVLDLMIGDPHRFPHPVRAIGAGIQRGERIARRFAGNDPARELIAGVALSAAILGATYATSTLLLRGAARCDRRLATILGVLLAWTTLATRNLLDEVLAVARALERDDLPAARSRLARVVGRDTAELDESEVARAAIETLAESLCDGVIAPLCALAAGGVRAATAFKAINTLDSMIGHSEPPYTFFGRAAARLDDIAAFIPARITALLIIAVSAYPSRAARVWLRDGKRHSSPNAGHCEAAMAGALGVRLGGAARYDGVVRDAPFIGAELRVPVPDDIRTALRITAAASLAGALLASIARGAVRA